MKTIFYKECRAYFISPIGYVFLTIYLLFFGYYCSLINLSQLSGNYHYVLNNLTTLLLFTIPLITMKLLSDERKNRTDQLLLTAPVKIQDIILGKYLAACSLLLFTLCLTMIHPVILTFLGRVPWSKVLCCYTGYFLLGASLVAIGLFISALTDNPLISGIGSVGLFVVLLLINNLVSIIPAKARYSFILILVCIIIIMICFYHITGSLIYAFGTGCILALFSAAVYHFNSSLFDGLCPKALKWLSLFSRYDSFSNGLLDISAVFYYLSVIFIFLFLTCQIIQKRCWDQEDYIIKKFKFTSRHMPKNSYHILLSLLIIIATLICNMLVGSLNIKLDTTKKQIYTLSDTTKELVKNIDTPINIYVLEETGKDNELIHEILHKYEGLNSYITITYKDPKLYPEFTADYITRNDENLTAIATGSLIIENEKTGKFKILTPDRFVKVTSSDDNDYSISLEYIVTSAVNCVLSAKDYGIYNTCGHSELQLSTYFETLCDNADLSINQLNLLTDALPDPEHAAIIINSPHTDFTRFEISRLTAFLNAGGKAMIFMDMDVPQLPVFDEFLQNYGIIHEQGLTVETNAQNMTSVYPTFLLPDRGDHPILEKMQDDHSPIIFPYSSGFKLLDDPRSSLTITPLLTTSEDAFLRTTLSNESAAKQTGDIDGPIDLAYAIEEKAHNKKRSQEETGTTKLVVVADSYCLSDKYIIVSSTGNEHFISSSLGWLLNINTDLTIENPIKDDYLIRALPASKASYIKRFIVFVMPCIVALTGIIVYWKRRRA